MQATSFAPFPNCCYFIPSHFHFQHPHLKRPKPVHLSLSNNQNHFTNIFALTLIPTIIATKQQEKNNNPNPNPNPDPNLNPSFVPQFYSCIATNKGNNQNPESQNQGKEEDHRDNQTKKAWGIFTNMWWAELKAAMGQRFNFEAIISSAMVVVKDRHLALPHVAVPDIRYIDWAELHRRGFRGVVFDKDNTITAPYSLNLWGPLGSSLEQCKSVFGPDIAVFSNSAGNLGMTHLLIFAWFYCWWFFSFLFVNVLCYVLGVMVLGLCEYDLDGSKARALEGAIGIKVIRHSECFFLNVKA
jgi:phosphatidylglycerophosphatase GEP4